MPEPGIPDQGAGRTRVPRCVDSPGLVVGLAGSAGLEAALSALGPARTCRCDLTLVLDHRGGFPRRVSPVRRGHADRAACHDGHGRARRISRLLPVLSALAFYPWSALVPAAVWGAWTRRKTDPDFGFLLGWVIGPWILLECLPTRLIHYYLPAYPGLCLLVAWMVEAVAAEEVTLRRWPLGRLGLGLLAGSGSREPSCFWRPRSLCRARCGCPWPFWRSCCRRGDTDGDALAASGSTSQAGIGLGATWAVFLLIVGGWLIPAAEPYRTSRSVGERLAVLSARTGIEPVLLNYQEPGVIYAMGKPVATVRDPAGFYDLLDRKASLLTVITPEERAGYPRPVSARGRTRSTESRDSA